MRLLERTDILCGRCFRYALFALCWKLDLGEPTFLAYVCERCDMMWEF